MSVAIASVSPQRVFGTSSPTITVTGTGFGAAGFNAVVVSGFFVCPITVDSPVSVSFTLPLFWTNGTVNDVHSFFRLTNTTTGERGYFWVRIKPSAANAVPDYVIESAIPGPFELTGEPEDNKRVFEARDMERLAALVEAWTRDLTAGGVLAFDGTGIAEPGNNLGSGQVLVADPTDPTGLKWASKQDLMLPFGGAVSGGLTKLVADGSNAAVASAGEERHWIPSPSGGGTVDLIWLLVKAGGGDTLDQVRLLRSGVVVYDSGAGLALGNNTVFTVNPAFAASALSFIELEASRAGAGTINLVGGCRVLLD